MAFCLLLCGKEMQKSSSQYCFFNLDQWEWQKLGPQSYVQWWVQWSLIAIVLWEFV